MDILYNLKDDMLNKRKSTSKFVLATVGRKGSQEGPKYNTHTCWTIIFRIMKTTRWLAFLTKISREITVGYYKEIVTLNPKHRILLDFL